MPTHVIILNGGSSAGKSRLARCLQDVLVREWLTFGADTLVEALPARLRSSAGGIGFAPGGEVATGDAFQRMDVAWSVGVAAIARAGVPVIVDEVFLGGPASQARWRAALTGLATLWVGVRCDPDVAAAREAARGDRPTGMARTQAAAVHRGVLYDVEVDTTHTDAAGCARTIATHVID
ncbi:chloramphenicol phosphotransferase CPT [Streptomyces sp. V4-01]|uniref:Chloramphenicol phosphotransferase CPT n=1 Tax=Actinacidiphila polyblastidii TaxID=3110430 RepID=A0ABU7PHT0_9ACTN|nr:chloramphenicol phosphotransferase CPT [Streptomyces sp. V4-01]